MGVNILSLTLDGQFCNGPAPFFHLADIDSIVVRGDVLNGEPAVRSLFFDVVLLALLEFGLLLEPGGLRAWNRHLALERGRLFLLNFNILQLCLERNHRLWGKGDKT